MTGGGYSVTVVSLKLSGFFAISGFPGGTSGRLFGDFKAKSPYAHIEIIVAFLVVNFLLFGHSSESSIPAHFWRKWLEILPFNLPDLPKTRTSKKHRRTKSLEADFFRKIVWSFWDLELRTFPAGSREDFL